MSFCSYGGGVHHAAYIGGPPEHRDWRPGDPIFKPYIAPTARVEWGVTVDAGMSRSTQVGERTWLLKNGTHVGHDAIVGDDCEISCGVKIGGFAEIGNNVRIGLGAVIRPYIKVGDGARIGIGAVVVKDVPPGEVHVGNPARKLAKVDEETRYGRLDRLDRLDPAA